MSSSSGSGREGSSLALSCNSISKQQRRCSIRLLFLPTLANRGRHQIHPFVSYVSCCSLYPVHTTLGAALIHRRDTLHSTTGHVSSRTDDAYRILLDVTI